MIYPGITDDLFGHILSFYSGEKNELGKQLSTVALVCQNWRKLSHIAIAKKLINTGMIKVTDLKVADLTVFERLPPFHVTAGRNVGVLDLSDVKNPPEDFVNTAVERYPCVQTVVIKTENLSLQTMQKIAALVNLSSFTISCGEKFEDRVLVPLAEAKNLQHLELRGFEQIDGSFLESVNLTHLVTFILTCASKLKENALEKVWGLNNLKCLTLDFSTLNRFSVTSKALERLELLNTTFANSVSPLDEIKTLTNLRQLTMTLGSGEAQKLGNLKLLRNLRLDKCQNLNDESFKACYKSRVIETLELANCNQLTRTSLEYIVENSSLLKSLTLKTCTKMFEGMDVDFTSLNQLAELQIWNCDSLTEEALITIIQTLPRLVNITLFNLPQIDFEKIKSEFPNLKVS